MTTEIDGNRTPLVPGAHRPVRVLGAGEGPFRGTLVATGDAVAVMVDADELAGWAGWSYAGCDHVAGPLDLVRRSDGHDVLLPWCTETIDAFLGRRTAIGAALTAGESSTLVVSLLRGVGEVREVRDRGRWWLTDGGRPVFVIGDGDDARAAAAALVEKVRCEGSDRALGRLLAVVHDGLVEGMSRPRMPEAQLERWEAELFEIAAPRPLDTAMHAPERVRGIEVLRGEGRRTPETRRAARSAALGKARKAGRWTRVQMMIADSAERVRAASTAVSVRLRRGGAPRRSADPSAVVPRSRKIVIAGAAAVAVVIGGVFWPGGATGEARPAKPTSSASEPSRSPEASASTSADEASSADPADDQRASDDPVAAAAALLGEIERCGREHDASCAEAVAEGSIGVVDSLADALSGEEPPAVEIVDAYGDIAVLRLYAGSADDGDEPTGAELMVVLVRLKERWLVRDVYGVADQPG